jgi:mannan endo-1,4-beta-mannosidase
MEKANKYKPINPHASEEVHQLLNYLYSIRGKYILSGQHNYAHQLIFSSQKTAEITGKYPAIWGADFLGAKNRQKVVQEAIRQHKKGVIITLMYHQVKPFDDDSLGFLKSVKGRVSDEEWKQIITPGTKYHSLWLKKIDNIAKYLKQLKQAKIPVLWRPFHEMNGIWFWWGDRPNEEGFKKLWLMMFDRYTNHHNLNNLIWVWNPNAPRLTPGDEAYGYEKYYPGHEYVDILAADVYHQDYQNSHHDELLKLAEGKLIALGEVGQVPTPQIIEYQNQWVWFMIWAEYNLSHNTSEDLKILFTNNRVLNLNDLPKINRKLKPSFLNFIINKN